MDAARVGIILDSSVIIAAERNGQSVLQIMERVLASQGNTVVGLSVVTVAELVHGAYRAATSARQKQRLAFIDELCRDVPVYPMTLDIARLVGRIEGQQAARGIHNIILSPFNSSPINFEACLSGDRGQLVGGV